MKSDDWTMSRFEPNLIFKHTQKPNFKLVMHVNTPDLKVYFQFIAKFKKK